MEKVAAYENFWTTRKIWIEFVSLQDWSDQMLAIGVAMMDKKYQVGEGRVGELIVSFKKWTAPRKI